MIRRFILPVILTLTLLGCSDDDTPEIWSIVYSSDFGRSPRFSPDGSSIAFGDDRAGHSGLWIKNDSDDPQRLAIASPHNWDYCWSPDNSRIAFSSPASPEDSLGGIWIVDVLTNETKKVFSRGRDVSWGESGQALFFQIENPAGGVPGIYALTIGDSLPRFIAASGIKPQGRPGTNQVAYADGSLDAKVWISSDGADPVEIPESGAIQWRWAGNGGALYIIYNHYLSGTIRGDLWRLDGSDFAKIDSLAAWAANLSVNRDGSRVVFTRYSGSTWLGIWLLREGKEIQLFNFGENPDIHPTEEKIAFNGSSGGIRIAVRTQ